MFLRFQDWFKVTKYVEEIKAKVSFDIIIETESGIKYKTTTNLDLPAGNILEEATSTTEINTEDLVLKRM